MLARYQIKRGVRAARLPAGVRQDTRKHTRQILRPDAEAVRAYLAGETTWETFAERYRTTVQARLASHRAAFDALAERARTADVYLGCSCPTKTVPDVRRCHTWLALELMKATYPDLVVRFPAAPGSSDASEK